jgi:adenylosuccinate lyase
MKGIDKLVINLPAIERDLEGNWMVIAEGIQTILRREGYPNPYESLKGLTRTNKTITRDDLHAFIDSLNIDSSVKNELKSLSPSTYTGIQF